MDSKTGSRSDEGMNRQQRAGLGCHEGGREPGLTVSYRPWSLRKQLQDPLSKVVSEENFNAYDFPVDEVEDHLSGGRT